MERRCVDCDAEAVLFWRTELEQETQSVPPRCGLTCHIPFRSSASQICESSLDAKVSLIFKFILLHVFFFFHLSYHRDLSQTTCCLSCTNWFCCHFSVIALWTVGVFELSTAANKQFQCSRCRCDKELIYDELNGSWIHQLLWECFAENISPFSSCWRDHYIICERLSAPTTVDDMSSLLND